MKTCTLYDRSDGRGALVNDGDSAKALRSDGAIIDLAPLLGGCWLLYASANLSDEDECNTWQNGSSGMAVASREPRREAG